MWGTSDEGLIGGPSLADLRRGAEITPAGPRRAADTCPGTILVRMMPSLSWWARTPGLCAASLCALVVAAPAAGAHPFGAPPTAVVSADGNRVVVEWAASPDDAVVVGMSIGVLDDASLERYLEGPVQTAPSVAKEEELAASEDLREYLLDRIGVAQDGRSCTGAVAPIGSFMDDGARVVYECPEPVTVVDLRITMLHDVHEAYRTFAFTEGGGQPQQSVFTTEQPEQRWDFAATSGGSPDGSDRWLAPLVIGLGGLAGAGGFAWWRRSKDRAMAP